MILDCFKLMHVSLRLHDHFVRETFPRAFLTPATLHVSLS